MLTLSIIDKIRTRISFRSGVRIFSTDSVNGVARVCAARAALEFAAPHTPCLAKNTNKILKCIKYIIYYYLEFQFVLRWFWIILYSNILMWFKQNLLLGIFIFIYFYFFDTSWDLSTLLSFLLWFMHYLLFIIFTYDTMATWHKIDFNSNFFSAVLWYSKCNMNYIV